MPNLAFILLVAGVLLIHGEFIWMRRFFCATAGSILALIAISMFWRLPHTNQAAGLTAAGLLLLTIEAATQTLYLAGIVATMLIACGFWKCGVRPQLAFPLTIALGAITTVLLSIAKQARRNKRSLESRHESDLPDQPHSSGSTDATGWLTEDR